MDVHTRAHHTSTQDQTHCSDRFSVLPVVPNCGTISAATADSCPFLQREERSLGFTMLETTAQSHRQPPATDSPPAMAEKAEGREADVSAAQLESKEM